MEYLTVGLTVVIFGGLVYIWYIKKEKDDLKRDLDNAEGVVKLSEKRINAVEASVLKNEKEKRENESEKAKNTTATEHLARLRAKYRAQRGTKTL